MTYSAKEAPWGDFELFRGTSWEHGIKSVSGEAYSHALHGFLLPLLRELGREPLYSGRKVLEEEGACKLKKACPLWSQDLCRPGGKKDKEFGPPGCYEPPLDENSSPEVIELFRKVAFAWKEGRHTLVVEGNGFNFR